MTNDQILNFYANLLIMQYRSKTKAYAHIKAIADNFVMNQMPIAVQDAFNLDTASGVQLDVIGKYAGVLRNQRTFTGLVTLSDTDYRILISIKIAENYSGSGLANIQNILWFFFAGSIKYFDHLGMRISVLVDSNFASSDLVQIFVRNGFIPRPMGVGIGALVYAPDINTKPFFGMRTYTVPPQNSSGFNTYSSYHTDRPWLNSSYAIVP